MRIVYLDEPADPWGWVSSAPEHQAKMREVLVKMRRVRALVVCSTTPCVPVSVYGQGLGVRPSLGAADEAAHRAQIRTHQCLAPPRVLVRPASGLCGGCLSFDGLRRWAVSSSVATKRMKRWETLNVLVPATPD